MFSVSTSGTRIEDSQGRILDSTNYRKLWFSHHTIICKAEKVLQRSSRNWASPELRILWVVTQIHQSTIQTLLHCRDLQDEFKSLSRDKRVVVCWSYRWLHVVAHSEDWSWNTVWRKALWCVKAWANFMVPPASPLRVLVFLGCVCLVSECVTHVVFRLSVDLFG